jgi:hypothetical protein
MMTHANDIRHRSRHLVGILAVQQRGRWLTACGRWEAGDVCTPLAAETTCPDCRDSPTHRAQQG